MNAFSWGRHDEPPVANAGGSGGGLGGAAVSLVHVRGAPLARITRANNVTAYAIGQVYGDSVDARISVVVPALPADARSGYSQMFLNIVQGTAPTAGAFSAFPVLFSAQPATVLADGAALSLSDADIDLIVPGTVTPNVNPIFTFGVTTVGDTKVLNQSAGVAGRRATLGQVAIGAVAQAGLTPGATYWFYIEMLAAYTPVAQETLDIFPSFAYTSGRSYP